MFPIRWASTGANRFATTKMWSMIRFGWPLAGFSVVGTELRGRALKKRDPAAK